MREPYQECCRSGRALKRVSAEGARAARRGSSTSGNLATTRATHVSTSILSFEKGAPYATGNRRSVAACARARAHERARRPGLRLSGPKPERRANGARQGRVPRVGGEADRRRPEHVATTAPNQPSSGAGSGLGGAGFGAARGAMSGDAAAGAARGVGIGRLVHAVRARRQMEEQQNTSQQDHQQKQAQLQTYDRAFSACLTDRGYTVQ